MGIPTYPPITPPSDGYTCSLFGEGWQPDLIVTFSGIERTNPPGELFPFANHTFILKPTGGCTWGLFIPDPPNVDYVISYSLQNQKWVMFFGRPGVLTFFKNQQDDPRKLHGLNEATSPYTNGSYQALFGDAPDYPSFTSTADDIGLLNNQKTFSEPMGVSADDSAQTLRFSSFGDGTNVYIKRP